MFALRVNVFKRTLLIPQHQSNVWTVRVCSRVEWIEKTSVDRVFYFHGFLCFQLFTIMIMSDEHIDMLMCTATFHVPQNPANPHKSRIVSYGRVATNDKESSNTTDTAAAAA